MSYSAMLDWYDKKTETFIGDEEADDLNFEELSKILKVPIEQVTAGGYRVDEANIEGLQKFYKHNIDLEKYIYIFEVCEG